MRSVPLTDLAVRNLAPPEKGYSTLWDGTLKGFGCMVGHGGTRSFCVLIASGRRKVIGKYPLMSVSEARRLAREMLAEKTLRKTLPRRHAFEDAKEAYLADVALRNAPRTHKDYTRLLNRHYPFGRKNLADIQPREIIKQLAHLPPIEKRYAHAVGKAFFKWATRQHIIDRSPMENLQPPKVGKPRERVLNDDELKVIYRTSLLGQTHFHKIVALLCLTGARRGMIAALEWEWVKDDYIEFPARICKNGKSQLLPIGPTAHSIIRSNRNDTGSPYCFPAARDRVKGRPASTFNGWSRSKLDFDREVFINSIHTHPRILVAPYTLHDIRRSVAVSLQRLGARLETVENILGHVGSRAGVVGIYQRYGFLEEQKQALLQLEQFFATLCPPEG